MTEREYCRVCGRGVRLTKDGRYGAHKPLRSRALWVQPLDPDQRCPGSGQPCWRPSPAEKEG